MIFLCILIEQVTPDIEFYKRTMARRSVATFFVHEEDKIHTYTRGNEISFLFIHHPALLQMRVNTRIFHGKSICLNIHS